MPTYVPCVGCPQPPQKKVEEIAKRLRESVEYQTYRIARMGRVPDAFSLHPFASEELVNIDPLSLKFLFDAVDTIILVHYMVNCFNRHPYNECEGMNRCIRLAPTETARSIFIQCIEKAEKMAKIIREKK